MQNRLGFTLVEVLLAVILIDVGLLALVAGSALLVRDMNELRARTAALHAASNRLQLLGAASCNASTGFAGGPRGIREAWAVEVRDNGVREIRDSVTVDVGVVEHNVVLRTELPC